jgi:hypothetical protein
MGANAGLALAIGSALCLMVALFSVVLCLQALRKGAVLEIEITARSFRLYTNPFPPHTGGREPEKGQVAPSESQHVRAHGERRSQYF